MCFDRVLVYLDPGAGTCLSRGSHSCGSGQSDVRHAASACAAGGGCHQRCGCAALWSFSVAEATGGCRGSACEARPASQRRPRRHQPCHRRTVRTAPAALPAPWGRCRRLPWRRVSDRSRPSGSLCREKPSGTFRFPRQEDRGPLPPSGSCFSHPFRHHRVPVSSRPRPRPVARCSGSRGWGGRVRGHLCGPQRARRCPLTPDASSRPWCGQLSPWSAVPHAVPPEWLEAIPTRPTRG